MGAAVGLVGFVDGVLEWAREGGLVGRVSVGDTWDEAVTVGGSVVDHDGVGGVEVFWGDRNEVERRTFGAGGIETFSEVVDGGEVGCGRGVILAGEGRDGASGFVGGNFARVAGFSGGEVWERDEGP